MVEDKHGDSSGTFNDTTIKRLKKKLTQPHCGIIYALCSHMIVIIDPR